ncbi:restriction modification system DNA specificity subunit [Streptomyces laurentii]|uniref:Restriction modification system DNA specificity subunit n=1 Tax=Streptomyces laurentii TaxID=39478 RepID=A0A160P5U0_STRLU|nr:restriction modification system DNA specificity subunit [Streptomyces laurentii]
MKKVRLRHLVQVNPLTRAFDLLSDDDELTFLPMEAVWSGSRLDTSHRRRKASVAVGYTRFQDGDVLVPKITPTFEAGRAVLIGGLIGGVGAGTTELHVLRPGPRIDARFLLYVVSTHGFLKFGAAEMYGVAGQQRVPDRYLRDLMISLPDLEDQRRIADFLDVETRKIEDLVSRKRHLVALLEERCDSKILSHVGASALVAGAAGEPTLPVRRLLAKVVRPPIADLGVVTAYRDGRVTARSLRRAEGYTLSASTEAQGQSVVPGDVVIHGLDGFAGAIGTSEASGNCSPVYHVCEPHNGGDSDYFGRLLRLLALQGYLGNFATSTRERAVDFRNWDLFGRIPLPVMPVDEQCEVGASIRRIRPLKELVERSAVLAAERRQALITAAVTGQFDVSTASGRNVTEGITA